MDEDRLHKLLDKPAVGKQIERFWQTHGFPDIDGLAKATGLTNLGRVKEGAIPQWPNLVKIVQACGSTLRELINFIDPGPVEHIGEIEIRPENRHLFEKLSTILKSNPRRVTGITVNLEDLSAAAIAEEVNATPPGAVTPPDKQEFARSRENRSRKAREPTAAHGRKKQRTS